jgi:hypothetical protein
MIWKKIVQQIQAFDKEEAKNQGLGSHKPLQSTVAHIGAPHKRSKTQQEVNAIKADGQYVVCPQVIRRAVSNDAAVDHPRGGQHSHATDYLDYSGDEDVFAPGEKTGNHQQQYQQQLPVFPFEE